MDVLIVTLLVILVVSNVVYFVWNIKNNRKTYRGKLNNDDIRYYELKSKSEFLIAIVTVIGSVLIFLGYSTVTDFKKELKTTMATEMKDLRDSVTQTRDSLKATISENTRIKSNLLVTSLELDRLSNDIKKTISFRSKADDGLRSLSKRVKEISEKNVLNRDFYIVENVSLNGLADQTSSKKFFFKDFITTKNERLPVFKTIPYVLSSSRTGARLGIYNITTEGFEAMIAGGAFSTNDEKTAYAFDLIIYY